LKVYIYAGFIERINVRMMNIQRMIQLKNSSPSFLWPLYPVVKYFFSRLIEYFS